MAAVTVEDCLKVIPNRFELVLVASHRAKALMNGAPAMYVSERVEKNTIVALREVGANLLDINFIENEIKTDIKDRNLFKEYKDDSILDEKKEEESDSTLVDDLSGNIGEDSDLSDSDDMTESSDEEYYDDLNTEIDSSLDIEDNDLDLK